MTFLTHLRSIGRKKFNSTRNWLLLLNQRINVLEQKIGKYRFLLLLFPLTFFVWGYFAKPNYYFPDNNGLLGDTYLHMKWGMENESFVNDHHLLYPVVPTLVIKGIIKIGLINPDNPDYLETVYWTSIFLVQLAFVSSLLLFSWNYFLYHKSVFDAVLILLLISVSYAAWLYGNITDVKGASIAMEFFSLSAFLWWSRKKNYLSSAVVAICICLSIFLYNGLLFFSFGLFLSFIIYLIFIKISVLVKVRCLILFTSILLIGALIFYKIEMKETKSENLLELYNDLADTAYLGKFEFQTESIKNNFRTNLNTSRSWIINHRWPFTVPIWYPVLIDFPVSEGMKSIMNISRLLLILLLVRVIVSINFWRKKVNLPLYISGLIISAITLAGFLFRQAGSIFYILAFPANIALFISIIFYKNSWAKNLNRAMVIILIICLFIYNGFSARSVYRHSSITSHPVYEESMTILNHAESKNPHYYRLLDLNYYPNSSVHAYYENKIGAIKWHTDSSYFKNPEILNNEIETLLETNKIEIYVGSDLIQNLSPSLKESFIFLDNGIYKLRK